MRRRTDDRGQGLAEFAIVTPIIVLIIFALFDAGRAVIFYTELTNAARVGARIAMVNQSNDSTCAQSDPRTFKCAAAETAPSTGIDPGSIDDVVIGGSDCALMGNCTVKVEISHPFRPVTPLIEEVFGPFDFSVSTTMTMERLYSDP